MIPFTHCTDYEVNNYYWPH